MTIKKSIFYSFFYVVAFAANFLPATIEVSYERIKQDVAAHNRRLQAVHRNIDSTAEQQCLQFRDVLDKYKSATIAKIKESSDKRFENKHGLEQEITFFSQLLGEQITSYCETLSGLPGFASTMKKINGNLEGAAREELDKLFKTKDTKIANIYGNYFELKSAMLVPIVEGPQEKVVSLSKKFFLMIAFVIEVNGVTEDFSDYDDINSHVTGKMKKDKHVKVHRSVEKTDRSGKKTIDGPLDAIQDVSLGQDNSISFVYSVPVLVELDVVTGNFVVECKHRITKTAGDALSAKQDLERLNFLQSIFKDDQDKTAFMKEVNESKGMPSGARVKDIRITSGIDEIDDIFRFKKLVHYLFLEKPISSRGESMATGFYRCVLNGMDRHGVTLYGEGERFGQCINPEGLRCCAFNKISPGDVLLASPVLPSLYEDSGMRDDDGVSFDGSASRSDSRSLSRSSGSLPSEVGRSTPDKFLRVLSPGVFSPIRLMYEPSAQTPPAAAQPARPPLPPAEDKGKPFKRRWHKKGVSSDSQSSN